MSGMRSQPDATIIFITIRICYRTKIGLYILAKKQCVYIYIRIYIMIILTIIVTTCALYNQLNLYDI